MRMRNIILFLIAISTKSWANCLSDLEVAQLKLTPSQKKFQHYLVIKEESCGNHGCEVAVYTQVTPKCLVNSLNEKGFILKEDLNSNSLILKKDNMSIKYNFNVFRGEFEL